MPELKLEGPGQSYVRVVADSVSEASGHRVTSFEVNMHRFVLAEMNTHCLFARNSASSRAIPVEKQLERYLTEPAFPVVWSAEQRGMQGGAELEGADLASAMNLFHLAHAGTAATIRAYLNGHPDKSTRLHKSLINRLMEPMQWHKALITSVTFDNFFDQRCHPDAQPELRVVAEMMKQLYDKSDPRPLLRGDWHLPYIHDEEEVDGRWIITANKAEWQDAREISSARCARTSYMTQGGRRDYSEDFRLYAGLISKHHWSPLEHVCTPWPTNVARVPVIDPDTMGTLGHRLVSRLGKFPGWQQWRHIVEAKERYESYR